MLEISSIKAAWRRFWYFGGAGYREALYADLAMLITDGLELQTLLDDVATRHSNRRQRQALFYRALIGRMSDGDSFAEALARWAPPSEIVIIEAAERAGRVEDGLRQASYALGVTRQIQRTVAGATFYPTAVFASGIVMLIAFAEFFVPMVAGFSDPAKWEGDAAALYHLSIFFRTNMISVLFAIAGFAAWVYWSLGNATGLWRDKLNGVPPWSLYRIREGSMFLVALSSMISAGIGEYEALDYIRKRAKPWLRRYVALMQRRLQDGQSLGKALDVPLFSMMMRDRVANYARMANADRAMAALGRDAMERGLALVRTSAKLMTGVMIFALLIFIVWVAAAFFDIVLSVGDVLSK